MQGRQSLVSYRNFPKGKGLAGCTPPEIRQVLLEINLLLLCRNDHRIGVRLLLDGICREVGGVSPDDVVGGAREALLVEAVLEDVALRCHIECNLLYYLTL